MLADKPELENGRKIAKEFENYGIFQPNTLTLRGTVADPNQIIPLGLNGGRLAEALEDIIHTKNGDTFLGTLYLEDVLELIDWAADISINVPTKTRINSSVPMTRQIIEFTDCFLKDTAKFTGYDASEGALYVLFLLCLAMHPKGPAIFAVDSFDHALNPRLAKKLMQIFCSQVLGNDDIRLFAVDRDKYGHAEIRRVIVSQELLKEGQPLSRLWINGRLGGVPELI